MNSRILKELGFCVCLSTKKEVFDTLKNAKITEIPSYENLKDNWSYSQKVCLFLRAGAFFGIIQRTNERKRNKDADA